jgi:hypothetical protein
MTVLSEVAAEVAAATLSAEWERAEALALLAHDARQGRAAGDEALDRLRALQAQVAATRAASAWKPLGADGLPDLALDVLALVLAPEASPRVAWACQSLHGRVGEPAPTLHLLQELLNLTADEMPALFAVIGEDGPLRRRGLIRAVGPGPFAAVRPARGLAARATRRDPAAEPPPGAVAVSTLARWEDLVLPESRLTMLREFLAYVTRAETLVGRWGARPPGGPIALFSGASGTGKTFAASGHRPTAWAGPSIRVDLGRLVSKYVGETEENLNRLFDAAHGQPMVLQFDEADALFAKRGEVKEARDRYANMEVSHLLTRIESHDGPCILTTNLRKQLDGAFTRRFQAVIDFPKPDAAAREALWRRSLPPKAPLAVDLDLGLIAEAAPLSGGHIRNAAFHAAVLAAEADGPVTLAHAALAVWRELAKEGRTVATSEIGALAQHLNGGAA